MSYAQQHLQEAARIIESLDADAIERIAGALAEVRIAAAVCSFSALAAAPGIARTR